jgi:hypothetical protein
MPALSIVLLTADCWLKIPPAVATVTIAVAAGTNLSQSQPRQHLTLRGQSVY